MRLVRPALIALLVLVPLPNRQILAEDEPAGEQPRVEKPAEEMTEAEREEALKRGLQLHEQGVALHGQGMYGEAIRAIREAAELRERVLGPEHPHLATSLNNLAVSLQSAGQHEEARAFFERALQIREKVLNPSDPDLAQTLGNLADLLRDMGQYEKARSLFERALQIRENALGPEHPDVAASLNGLALLHQIKGQYEKALPLFERALDVLERTLGPDHPHVGTVLNNSALLLHAMGRYERAELLFKRSVRIKERALGSEHPAVADSLHNLARLLQISGHYEQARLVFERSYLIRVGALGPEHPRVATSLNDLGELHLAMGRYERARPLLERALRIRRKTLGPEHPAVALSMNALAVLLQASGQHQQALPLLERALRIQEASLGPRHAAVATSLNNLGTLLSAMGSHGHAQNHYERALRIREAALGRDHRAVAVSLNNLAVLLMATGQYEQARPLYERTLAILEKVLGPEHPHVAMSASNLGVLFRNSGNYKQAQHFYENALRIRESALGTEHPDVAVSLGNLAELYLTMGLFDQAYPPLDRALNIVEKTIRRNLSGLQVSERRALVRSLLTYLGTWFELATSLARSGHEKTLRFKGLVARATAAERRLSRQVGANALAQVVSLRVAERRCSQLANAMPPMFDKEKHAAWREAYAKAGAEREKLAVALAKEFAPFREGLERLDLNLQDIQAHLGSDEVLVDYLRSGDGYLAWIIRHEGEVERFNLGVVEAVENAAEDFAYRAGDGDTGIDDEAWLTAGRALRDLVWTPIEERMGDEVHTVYLCPDAGLAAVPFAALPCKKEGRFLIDDYLMVEVAMAQDLVPWSDAPKLGDGAVLVGDVNFQSASAGPSGGIEPMGRGLAVVDRAPRGASFLPLPDTKDEVEFLRRRLGETSAVLLGEHATEARFRAESRGKRILHLATHGFVRDDLLRGLRRRKRGEPIWLGADMERHLAVGHDPMNLAGLAFAGANPRDGGHGDDGILTAAEASYLDLDGVDLVVLSACETALGKAESGEGVIGLVQGFQMAGAKRVIASLWQVDDEATRLLMQHLYDGMLRETDPLSPAEALRAAALKVRGSTGSGGRSFAAPRYWASFMCYGR